MMDGELTPAVHASLKEVVGYLNFSSGTSDPVLLRNLNDLFRAIESSPNGREAWQVLYGWLTRELPELQARERAFRNVEQAQAAIAVTFEGVLPAYLAHHRDLLFHQTAPQLFRPFFIGRVFETVLRQSSSGDETADVVQRCVHQLNDFIGHRPIPVLETEQKIEPYPHERVRPIPVFVLGAGVAVGPYEGLIQQTLTIFNQTDPDVLQSAWFDPQLMDELAYDPRAYDFNHTANKRPNYHFGQWDPHHIDRQGRYRRFVLQQVSLDALLARVGGPSQLRDELLFEAAAVLAGTMLMASGTSGSGPDTHDSSTTLTTLLPRIAAYRDAFYAQLLERMTGPHGERLRAEALALRQPFGAARQHLNQQLGRWRALQLQRSSLALLFARMGYPDAAMRQADHVRTASARMVCQMQCLLTTGFQAAVRGRLDDAAACLPQIEDLLHRAIECGALIDPWNIIGFAGQFSVFQAIENSVGDPRAGELIDLMEQIFGLYSRVWSEAGAANDAALAKRVSRDFTQLAQWWDQFASATVSSVKPLIGMEMAAAAESVANALSGWHRGGAASGNTAFWRPYAEHFDSPKAYARVVEALLEKGDTVASMALLVHWIGQAERVSLDEGDSSFHALAQKWLDGALYAAAAPSAQAELRSDAVSLVQKFFDYMEVNADQWWKVPQLEIDDADDGEGGETLLDEMEDQEDLFGAAYEGMSYRDSTADGFEADMLEAGSEATEYELDWESKRLARRLAFLTTVARLSKKAAMAFMAAPDADDRRGQFTQSILRHASDNRRQLLHLLKSVQNRPIPAPSATQESLIEYDRRRMIKDVLLERVIAACVAAADAERMIKASAEPGDADSPSQITVRDLFWRAVVRGDVPLVRKLWPEWLADVERQPLLYVPVSKGGDPVRIVAARSWQLMFRQLLTWLPRAGMLSETVALLKMARRMESEHPLGPGAVTEFDRLYEMGYKALVESLVDASLAWGGGIARADEFDGQLIDLLRQLTEKLLSQWLAHSRTLRLSALEKVGAEKDWHPLVEFIERYGRDIFVQKFFNLGNLRAILHQGVAAWLQQLEQEPDRPAWRLFDDLDASLPRAEAQQHITTVIEAIVEDYEEYRDYNSTTTQSDRGDLLYGLLDFLRLKAAYQRVTWNLRPVVMAHDVLVRRGCVGAAEVWQRAMADRTTESADEHLARLAQLQAKYAMKLATVADRIGERFIRPLSIDRIKALVKPATDDARAGKPLAAFARLEQETMALVEHPSGAGLDLPDWLSQLDDEVTRAASMAAADRDPSDNILPGPRVVLTLDKIKAEFARWREAGS